MLTTPAVLLESGIWVHVTGMQEVHGCLRQTAKLAHGGRVPEGGCCVEGGYPPSTVAGCMCWAARLVLPMVAFCAVVICTHGICPLLLQSAVCHPLVSVTFWWLTAPLSGPILPRTCIL